MCIRDRYIVRDTGERRVVPETGDPRRTVTVLRDIGTIYCIFAIILGIFIYYLPILSYNGFNYFSCRIFIFTLVLLDSLYYIDNIDNRLYIHIPERKACPWQH